MSYARKKGGYREIAVEGVRYRWSFRAGADDGRVTLQGADSGRQQAIITVSEARDPWLSVGKGSSGLRTISPKLIRPMIQQALSAGWQPAQRGKTIQLNFEPDPVKAAG